MDINNYVDNAKAQLRRGTLEYCVLAAISQREMYASDIIALLKQYDLLVVEGTLYPILSRLKEAGLASYSWSESNEGPPRKYYSITENGRRAAEVLSTTYESLSNSIKQLTQSIWIKQLT